MGCLVYNCTVSYCLKRFILMRFYPVFTTQSFQNIQPSVWGLGIRGLGSCQFMVHPRGYTKTGDTSNQPAHSDDSYQPLTQSWNTISSWTSPNQLEIYQIKPHFDKIGTVNVSQRLWSLTAVVFGFWKIRREVGENRLSGPVGCLFPLSLYTPLVHLSVKLLFI